MSQRFNDHSVASADDNSTSGLNITSEVETLAGVVQLADDTTDVWTVGDNSVGNHVIADAEPPGYADPVHIVSDASLADVVQTYASGADFFDLPQADRGPLAEPQNLTSDENQTGGHLSDNFDSTSTALAGTAPDVAFNSPHDFSGETNSIGIHEVFSDAQGGTHGGGGGGTHGGGGGHGGGGPSSGLTIHVTFDSSVSSAPAGFTDVVNQVVQYFESHFSDPITININVGYGEVNGTPLNGALGESETFLAGVSYSSLLNALSADATTSFDQSAVASLPSTDPTGQILVSTAEAKALGFKLVGAPSVDGYAGFSNESGIFDYDNSDGVAANSYDFFGVVAHEFSEIMGRILLVGGNNGTNMLYDLFHYSADGVRDFSGTTPGYFSIDGGQTSLNTFNTVAGGDAGDWAGDTVDAFNAFGSPGVVMPISTADLVAMDVIGYNSTSTTTYTASSSSLTMAQLENQHPAA